MLATLLGSGCAGVVDVAAAAPAVPAASTMPDAIMPSNASVRSDLAATTCRALQQAASAIPGDTAMLLASYPTIGKDGRIVAPDPLSPAPLPALESVAFVYDNALAGIALAACGAHRDARRIADAFLLAPSSDPDFHDGRLRNAYRAGAVENNQVALPGYWDSGKQVGTNAASAPSGSTAGFWNQDPYQMGTATGNAAWAALLLLTVYAQQHDARYRDAAIGQLQWIDRHTLNAASPAGYQGGVFGYAVGQQVQTWKSTEHNIDVYAAAQWALASGKEQHPESGMQRTLLTRMRKTSGDFVAAMWNDTERRFDIGTDIDGMTHSTALSGIDAQVWPLLAFQPTPPAWRGVWDWVDREHTLPSSMHATQGAAGYGFKRQPDGIWTEGTGQAAAALEASGKPVPDALWHLLHAQRAPDGLLYATPTRRISTGLSIGPNSTSADFYYYHLPHLGATAWAALAARGWNPFNGQRIDAADTLSNATHDATADAGVRVTAAAYSPRPSVGDVR